MELLGKRCLNKQLHSPGCLCHLPFPRVENADLPKAKGASPTRHGLIMASEKTQEKEIFWLCLVDFSANLPWVGRRKALSHPVLLSSTFPPALQSLSQVYSSIFSAVLGSTSLWFCPLKQLHQCRHCCSPSPAYAKQQMENNADFLLPITAKLTFLQATTAVLNQTLPGLVQNMFPKHVWWLLNMNGKAKYFSTSVKRMNQTHTASKHPS